MRGSCRSLRRDGRCASSAASDVVDGAEGAEDAARHRQAAAGAAPSGHVERGAAVEDEQALVAAVVERADGRVDGELEAMPPSTTFRSRRRAGCGRGRTRSSRPIRRRRRARRRRPARSMAAIARRRGREGTSTPRPAATGAVTHPDHDAHPSARTAAASSTSHAVTACRVDGRRPSEPGAARRTPRAPRGRGRGAPS